MRTAGESEATAVSRLLRTAEGSHIHVDWRLPVDWLGSPGFVVMPAAQPESGRLLSKFFTPQERLAACLAATADPPPAAWVRVAAVARAVDTQAMLGQMLAVVEAHLRETAVTQLGWLVAQGWPSEWLPALGFARSNEIETFGKDDFDVPSFSVPPDLHLRPAQSADFVELAAMETAVFEPLWRLSAETLAMAQRDALCFDVAEWNGRLVGYQLSSSGPYSAHLVRLTIAKEAQGHGVGSALLAKAIGTYRQLGLRRATLNTQVDNLTSQRLYRKFGFYATGERLPVWSKAI
ncbi:MAG: GNAT family N-acetyltransferase [Ardenticatenaceae bacterium]|nr:GNAT family N-acetyltransferase [Ardenticatenaceae bacterium]MCB8986263.1 GNAT family N-acetyltransferase [Ardenticatenaceae bacterium]